MPYATVTDGNGVVVTDGNGDPIIAFYYQGQPSGEVMIIAPEDRVMVIEAEE